MLPNLAIDGSQKAKAPTASSSTEITVSDAAPSMTEAPTEVIEAKQDELPPQKQLLASNDPMPVKDADVVAPILPSKKSPRFATALPAKHAKVIQDTADDADAKLKQALSESRHDARPEVAGDIPVSVVAQNNMPEQLQPDATFPEDSATQVSAPQQQQQQQPPRQQFAPIQKSAQIGSTATAQGAIRNGDDLKEAPGNIRPVYPMADRRAGHQGTVVFIARLMPDGQVINIRVEKSSSSPSLDSAAYSAFRTYRYKNGQEGMLRTAFTFTLKGDAVEAPVARR